MRHTISISLPVFLLFVSAASAQIDKRVNTGNLGAGYSKDANTQVGSGGINLTRPGMFDAGAYSNAVVTGNVTGLAGFRGDSPILGLNQFREGLPSAGLSSFLARSVSAYDARPNTVPGNSIYLGRPETVTDAGFIRQGYNVADSYATRSQNIAPERPQSFGFGNRPIAGKDPTDRRIQGPIAVDSIGVKQKSLGRTFDPDSARASKATYRSPFSQAVSSPIFGSPPSGAGGILMRNPLSLDKPNDVLADMGLVADADDRTADSVGESGSTGLSKRLDGKQSQTPGKLGTRLVDGSKSGPGESGGIDTRNFNQRDFTGRGETTIDGRMPPTAATYGTDAPVNLGADRFADLYNAVRTAEQFGVSQFGFIDKERPAEARWPDSSKVAAGGSENPLTAGRPEESKSGVVEQVEAKQRQLAMQSSNVLERSSMESLQQLASKAKWARDTLEDPIATFAGHYESDLNRIIIEAERMLQKAEYYRAANQFELACLIDPRNPLPYLGRGHAWIAAGDYVSGLASILEGIDRFPQIAAFRLDLPALVGNRDVFDRRRADLSQKLERMNDYQLRFLLGYLELYSGLSVEGLRDVELAAQDAPAKSTIRRFNDLLHDRGTLPELPE